MSFTIQKPKPLYDQVYESIRFGILTGQYSKEERLNEVHIAQKLEISRGPVREAMRRLEQDGLIVRDQKNQLFVYQTSVEDLIHIYQCRAVLETLAASLAATNGTNDEFENLGKLIDETKSLLNHTDAESEERLISLNSDFHDTIFTMSRNPRLEMQLTQLRALTYFYRAQNTKGANRRKQIFEDHNAIYNAICSRNAEVSASLMKEHIERDAEHLIAIFKGETA